MGSTRLPNKPLADICGLPMIVQVVKRVYEAGIDDVYVAAAEKEIIDILQRHKIKSVLTDPSLSSGTDRIYQALEFLEKQSDLSEYQYVINVQGDLPTIEPKVINQVIELIKTDKYDIATAVAKITDNSERANPNVVKAIVSWKNSNEGKALYFTRATCPSGEGDLYHHIGLYAFKMSALKKFVSLNPSKLEVREKLEQLRALENDMTIGVVETKTVPLGVDTIEDLEKARNILANM
jgi:3-deoxy-manno-octulosonate cytidylyltransferase (CMP-KDO synthetase)